MNSVYLRPFITASLWAFLASFPLVEGLVKSLPPAALSAVPSTENSDGNSRGGPSGEVHIAMDPYLYGCSDDERQMVLEAWKEAGTLAYDHFEWFPKTKWQDAMTLYMGKKSEDDHSWWFGEGPLEENTRNQYYVHHGGFFNSPALTYAYFYCHEEDLPSDKKKRKNECGENTTAFTFDDPGFFWTAHYVVFCPTFFGKRMTSLRARTDEANGDPEMQRTINIWRATRARSLFHETYHWAKTVSDPKCNLQPERYQPLRVVELAATDFKKSVINAESWAQAAMAIHLQKTFGLISPPVPEGYRGSEQTSDAAIVDANALEEKFLDKQPEGFIPPVRTDSPTFDPDMENVVQLGTLGPLVDFRIATCEEGTYASMDRCSVFCDGGKCSQDKGKKTTTCSECKKEENQDLCSNISFEDFDACHASCHQGLCIESAGVDGITCECP